MKHVTRNKDQKGFTLIEAVVSATIFAFVITSIMGTYLAVLKLNSRTRALRALGDNSRFITEFFSKEIRNGHIDYPQYTSGTVPGSNNELFLVNQNNESEHIFLYNQTSASVESNVNNCITDTCDLMLAKNTASSPLNSTSVRITNLKILVAPNRDPYTKSNGTSEQPHVTLVLELTANVGAKDAQKMDLQSTYTELYYPARQ